MKNIFSKFLYLFNRKEKTQILLIFSMILLGVLLETGVVGLIYPFTSVLGRPQIIHEHRVLSWIYNIIGTRSVKEFLVWTAIGLMLVYIFKNAYLIFSAYTQTRFVFNKQVLLSRRLLAFYLQQPYTYHLQVNTAGLLHKINNVTPALFNGFLFQTMTFTIETITTVSILGLLIFVNPLPSIVAVSLLGAAVYFFYRKTREKIGEFGKSKQYHREHMILWVNQGLGGLKETKVLGREEFFVDAYNKHSQGYVRAERFLYVINQLPRPFLETICIVGMLLLTLLLIARGGEFQSVIPTLTLFGAAAFRIVPSMGRIFASATAIRYNSYSVEMIYNDLVSRDKDVNKGVQSKFKPEISIDFNDKVELRNVSYQYPNAKNLALKNVSLSVPKQYFVGLVGPSGAGKTTIVDIILGLLTPTHGEVLVDGRNIKDNLSGWQRKIGYIPQNIYLSDDTIRRNIAFGLDDKGIDDARVWSVLENAQLNTFVKGLPSKLDTMVGERGIRLSGGQRQRIGIARALYHNPEVLVMDEGTASLDNETERGIMQALSSLSGKKTIIIIAHRLSTVKNCNLLYFIKDGTVTERGTYDELFEKSSAFKSMVMSTEYK